MGMYDTILVPCPKCGTKSMFQSKGGPCMLNEYELDEVPMDVLSDVNRHAPNTCEQCGTRFQVGGAKVADHCKTCRCVVEVRVVEAEEEE